MALYDDLPRHSKVLLWEWYWTYMEIFDGDHKRAAWYAYRTARDTPRKYLKLSGFCIVR